MVLNNSYFKEWMEVMEGKEGKGGKGRERKKARPHGCEEVSCCRGVMELPRHEQDMDEHEKMETT